MGLLGGARLVTIDSGGNTTDSITRTTSSVSTAEALPPLDLSNMAKWNWGGTWVASEWNNANSPIPWRYARVQKNTNGETRFVLNNKGAPQLQGGGGTMAHDKGVWEVDVTLPQLRDGLVVAPLWLYNSKTRDEIDFEFAGKKGLDVTIHHYVNGKHFHKTVRKFAGTDFSNRRVHLAIKLDTAAGIADMMVDGQLVHRFGRQWLGYFTESPMKPWIEMWAANPNNSGFVQWVGKWQPLALNQNLTMVVRGYRYSQVP